MKSDFELLDAWDAGDRKAGSKLFERHFEALYVFFQTKVPEAADDLIQSTFLACLQSRASFRRQASFRTFLFGIARNKLLAHLREASRRAGLVAEHSSLEDLGVSPSRLVGQHEHERLLLAALRSLPLDLQIALELYYWERLTGSELALVFGVPEGTIRTRLKRARELLARHIEDNATAPLLRSTLDGLEDWARGLREVIAAGRPPADV